MPKTRAQREAEFRASHGMSSGAWYEMRRKATSGKGAMSKKAFDKLAGNLPAYRAVKAVRATKRAAAAIKKAGGDTAQAVVDIKDAIEDLPPDIEITWGTP